MKINKNKTVLRILFLLIIILVGLIGYVFVLNPILTGYAIDSNIEAQEQGMQYVVYTLLTQSSPPNCKPTEFNMGNLSGNFIATECLE